MVTLTRGYAYVTGIRVLEPAEESALSRKLHRASALDFYQLALLAERIALLEGVVSGLIVVHTHDHTPR